ncbi:MAG: N-acetylmuramoyl-L-alanine amidase sle1 precursor [Microgenomates group bacterium ADurb.Bin219]|nr:MAG: N-acetylmuramoyl-L-alanine amidase sle1 precursor [Microgenomates group bacterium ADurb.Bin219]
MNKEGQRELGIGCPTKEFVWSDPILVATNFAGDLGQRLGIVKKNEVVDANRFNRLLQGSLVISSTMWNEQGEPVTPWKVALESLQTEGKISPRMRKVDQFSRDQLRVVEQTIGDLGDEGIKDILSQERTLYLASRLELAGEPLAVFSKAMTERVGELLERAEEKIRPLGEYLKNNPQVRKTILATGSVATALLLISSLAPENVVASSPNAGGRITTETHIVQPGENLSKLADFYGVTIDAILRANPGITDPNFIRVSQMLIIPSASTSGEPKPETQFHPFVDRANNYIYTVQPGNTLGEIAKRYNTTVRRIAFVNGLTNPNLIRPGQKLRIPDIVVGFSCVVEDYATPDCQGEKVSTRVMYEPYDTTRCITDHDDDAELINSSHSISCNECPTGVNTKGQCLTGLEKVPKK